MTLYFARRFFLEYLTPRQMRRHLRWLWQRWTRGWDDRECWSLDYTIAKFVAPRLEHLRDCHIGFPGFIFEHSGNEIWTAMLDKMAQAMRITENEFQLDYDKDRNEYAQEGLELFAEYFWNLWD